MEKCKICNKEFKNNLGGQLTVHLKKEHNISYEDYYVKYFLDGNEPKCACGFCDERPNFYRGKFSKYAIGHEKFEWIEKQYVLKYGKPKCQNPECNNEVKFHRGIPNKYCSFKCQPSQWNQKKVKQTVKEKYGVENVFQAEEIKKKSKKSLLIKYGVEYNSQSEIIKEKIKQTNLKKYGVSHYMKLKKYQDIQKNFYLKKYGVISPMHLPKNLEKASKKMCEYNSNPNRCHTLKKYKNTKLYYQSLYEYRFLELCEKLNFLHLIDNAPRFQYLEETNGKKYHIPDFKYKNNYIIEIKSTYWLNRQGGMNIIFKKKESVEKQGYKYILLLDENNQDFLDII